MSLPHAYAPHSLCLIISILQQENLEKTVFQDKLVGIESVQTVVTQFSKALHNLPLLSALHEDSFADSSSLSLNSLPRSHLEQLAACHNLCTFTFLYSWSPTSFLVKWLTVRGHELVEDDRLLVMEGDLDNLTTKEVIEACLRRGILTKGVYATLVLQTDAEEDEDADGGNGDANVDTGDEDITKLMKDNWDTAVLRKRLRQWVSVVSMTDNLKFQKNISFYLHASALGLLVQK